MSTGAPCLGVRTEAYPVILPGGRRVTGRTWGWRGGTCPIDDHVLYAGEMASRGLHRQGLIGACRATLFRLQDCYDVIAEMLERGKDGFPPCRRCPVRPRVVGETVESDWDAVNERPMAGSEAWGY
jgi:hypothetical protein